MTVLQDQAFTDTKNHVYWGLGLGGVAAIIGLFGVIHNKELGLSYSMLVIAAMEFVAAYLHSRNGKVALMTLKEKGVQFQDGIFVPYTKIEKIWAGDPMPMLQIGFLNIYLTLSDDAEIAPSGKNRFKGLLFQSVVTCSISRFRKIKMVSLQTPGLRPLNGPRVDPQDVVDALFERVEAAKGQLA